MTAGWGASTGWCSGCGDEYDPEGYVPESEPHFCSEACLNAYHAGIAYEG